MSGEWFTKRREIDCSGVLCVANKFVATVVGKKRLNCLFKFVCVLYFFISTVDRCTNKKGESHEKDNCVAGAGKCADERCG